MARTSNLLIFVIFFISGPEEPIEEAGDRMSLSMIEGNTKSTLHEVIMAEKLDFEAKLERMARRKQWLKAHQQLLRTLLSYSVLHGSCGGGLASVRMELILLLQVMIKILHIKNCMFHGCLKGCLDILKRTYAKCRCAGP